MYKRCTTEKGAEQQKKLQDTLLSWMKDTSYQDISVRGLCEKSGVSRKTFYRLFDSKEDVLYALIDQALLNYENYTDTSITEQDPEKRELQNFFSYWHLQEVLLDALYINNKVWRVIERSVEHILANDPRALKFYGADDPKCYREVLIYHVSGSMSLMLTWYDSGFEKSLEEMGDLLYKFLTTTPAHLPIV